MPYYFLFLLLFLVGCSSKAPVSCLSSVNVVDQSGMTQTIGSKERLKKFSGVDFLKAQPYQKVLRVFTPRADGSIPAVATSYYPSGQIKQCLTILSGRALGPYQEWHENGALKIDACLVGGSPQLGSAAERTWIFHGPCKAYNDLGKLLGSMTYARGLLEGEALYWTNEGVLLKKLYYEKGALEGEALYYYESGEISQKITYHKGERNGPLVSLHLDGSQIAEECYENGRLMKGLYKENGVTAGFGFRYIEQDAGSYRLEEIRGGQIAGTIKEYKEGRLVHSYNQIKGVKEGNELFFGEKGVIVLEVPYKEGRIQGEVITRYPEGALQSSRVMSNNVKNGLLRAWYPAGQIMMIEEYSDDNLQSGSYYKCGSGIPVSKVVEGEGVATLFDSLGSVERKITYKDSKPN